ncbi:hypothetical protein [Streptomyces sp. NPDC020667]|uniref:hypothetical protein n=1 Tax=Streptomyces sp. NPDC020667 TaxID=3154895 RepID=UPI0034070A58
MELLDQHDLRPGPLRDLLAVHHSGGLEAGELTGLAASLFFDGHILLSAHQLTSALLCLFTHSDWLARNGHRPRPPGPDR